MAQKFYELDIWKKGYVLSLEIHKISNNFPETEKYGLTSQINRSANGAIANIAEAHGRFYYADKIRVIYTARAEVEETQSHLRVALGKKYINEPTFERLDFEYEGLLRGINKYINSTSKKIKSNR